jgi:hypothetical protein
VNTVYIYTFTWPCTKFGGFLSISPVDTPFTISVHNGPLCSILSACGFNGLSQYMTEPGAWYSIHKKTDHSISLCLFDTFTAVGLLVIRNLKIRS